MKNIWFEDTFLPSLESRMNNPEYPFQVILTEKQEAVCMKYMKKISCVDVPYWEYTTGSKRFRMTMVGKYTFLNLHDESKWFWAIRDVRTQEYIKKFDTEQEMIDWLDNNLDDETGSLNGTEYTSYTGWTTGKYC